MNRFRLLNVIALLLLVAIGLNAQVAGRISGTIVDQTGAVIPGATVNVYVPGGKEPVLTAKSNDAGMFLLIAVRPETYDVGIEASGFGKSFVRGVKVSPLQENSLGQVKMEVLSTSQSIEVTAEVQAVNTTNAEVSTTISNEQVQNLPVLGRQISNLFATMPGVSSGSGTTSVNGLRSSYSNVTLDGINIQDNFIRTNGLDYMPFRPTIDQVAEITISTSNQAAAIGGGASQFSLSTKSGSNQYHGAVYWYNRNDLFGANDWFNNAYDTAKSRVNLNQPGLAFSGHIIKDKLFFYTNYEWYRNKNTTPLTRTVLTDSAKNGVFTYVDSAGATKQANLLSLRPSLAADATVKAMIAQLPSGNAPGGDGLNTTGYRFNSSGNEFRDQFVYRGDYYLSPKHSFSGSISRISDPTLRPSSGTHFLATPPVSNTIRNQLLSLSWRSTITPTLTNEVRIGYARTMGNFDVANYDKYPKYLVSGLIFSNPVNTYMPQGRQTNNYPIQSNASWVKGRHQITFGFQYTLYNTAPFNDAGIIPTYTLGMTNMSSLALTATDLPGIKSANLTTANSFLSNLAGIISSGAQTFNVKTTTSGFVNGATNLRELKYSTYAGYVGDNFRLLPNLTLNLGVRYEYWTPLDEKNSLYLAPLLKNNDAKATVLDPTATLDFIGKSAGRPFYKSDKNNFAPNLGFAWNPVGEGKLTLRGGYMLAYVNDNVITSVRNSVATAAGLSSSVTTQMGAFLSAAPAITIPAYKVPRTLADNYASTTTSAVGIPDPKLSTPYVHQWNLTLQEEVKGIVFSAQYVGNKGSNLLRAVDYNQIQYNLNGFLADFKRAQSNASLSEKAGFGYIGAFNSAVPGSQQLTVFPLLSNPNMSSASSTVNSTYLRQGRVGELANYYMINKLNGSLNFYENPNIQGGNVLLNSASSIFHSLQLSATKRMRSGLQMQFSYTWGKNLSNAAGDGQTNFEPLLDNNNPAIEWARTPYDIKHVLKANYYYELPIGKGKRFSAGRVLDTIVGGWAISGIWNYQSGAPYSILSAIGTLNRDARSTANNTASIGNTDFKTLQPLTSGIWKQANGLVTFISPTLINTDGRGAAQFGSAPFAGQTFFNPDAGTVGNTQRRMFSGPWLWSWDASIRKEIKIKERYSLSIHVDSFNWANHPTFYVYPQTGDYAYTGYNVINNTTFGMVDSMQYDPRVFQFGAYFKF